MHAPAVDGSWAVNVVRQGTLTQDELAQLGAMLERGQVQSDPHVASPGDPVVERRSSAPASRTQPEPEWQVPRTVDELLGFRRVLLYESDLPDEFDEMSTT